MSRKLIAIIFFALGIAFHVGWLQFRKPSADMHTLSPGYLRAVINDCPAFTILDNQARRAVAVTKVGPNPDSGGSGSWIEFKWVWASGDSAVNSAQYDAIGTIDYNETKQQWYLGRFSLPGEKCTLHMMFVGKIRKTPSRLVDRI